MVFSRAFEARQGCAGRLLLRASARGRSAGREVEIERQAAVMRNLLGDTPVAGGKTESARSESEPDDPNHTGDRGTGSHP